MKSPFRISVFFRENIDKSPKINEKPKLKEIIDPKAQVDDLNQDVLEGITNKDFLSADRSGRLKYLTSPSVDGKNIINNQEIEFKFSFNGKLNKNLYLNTTAGQLLPATVQEVTTKEGIWIRSSLYGEFFNSQGKRLIIHDKTQVNCSKVISEDETKAMEQKIVGDNDKYKTDSDYSIILECAKRNIGYEVAKEIFAPELRKNGNNPSSVDIEILITRFERIKDNFRHDFQNLAIQKDANFAPEFLSYFVSYEGIKISDEVATKFGITTEIRKLTDNGSANMGIDEEQIDNGENLKGQALWNHPPFHEKVIKICDKLGINPDHLKIIMEHESRINPKVVNRLTGKATGLIQFMPKTAEGLGTTTGKLRMMSGVDQLDYVEKYYAQYSHKGLKTLVDLYLATFYPRAIGKGEDYVIGSETGNAGQIAMENPFPRTGQYITVGDVGRFIES